MPQSELLVLGILVATILVTFLALGLLYARLRVKVEQGYAVVVTKPTDVHVSFTGALVLPIVHRAEVVDLRVKTVIIDRSGSAGFVCRDDVRADVTATFYVRINNNSEDVRKVSALIGCRRANDQATLEELFVAKFAESLKVVFREHDFEELSRQRDQAREQVLALIGEDLSGYVLHDLAIDRLEQTPIEQLDPRNIMDAKGIRKIVEATTRAEIARNEVERELRTREIALRELIIEHERRKGDALSSYVETTGKTLSDEVLEARIEERLRALVEPLVADALAAAATVPG